MNLNPKKSQEVQKAFLTRWPLEKVKKMTLEEYVGYEDKDTFCYWLETKTRPLGSIKGYYSKKFGIYERGPDEEVPKSDQFLHDKKYNWWKKYGSSRNQAFTTVRDQVLKIIIASSSGKFDLIDNININHWVKWKVASLYSNQRIVPIFKLETLDLIAKDLNIKYSKRKYSHLYESLLIKKPKDQDIYQYAYNLYSKYEKQEEPANYWITVHWPRLKSQHQTHIPSGVFLPDGRQKAGKELKKGDKILIYESYTGRTVVSKDINGNEVKDPSLLGKMGIIAIVEAKTNLRHDPNQQPTFYSSSKPITWSWYAETKLLTQNGFVSLKEVNKVLGYKESFTLRGFGDYKSGLKRLSIDQFEQLLSLFKLNSKQSRKSSKERFGHGGESPAHKRLKKFVASNPEYALKEEGLMTVKVEFPFPSADKADIILKDRWGKYIGVEIELEQDLRRFEGALQAIKYRFMAAYMFSVDYTETRSMLIAHKLSPSLIKECEKYDIECHVIKKSDMI